MSLLAAVLTAAFIAGFGVPFQHYQCWFSWAWLPTNLGIFAFFIVAGGGGGLLAWIAAEVTNVQPSTNELINGVVYGLSAGAVLRADFGARPQRTPDRSSAQGIDKNYAQAASLLTKCLTWLSSSLDNVAALSAEKWLRRQSDDELLVEVFRVKAYIDGTLETKRQKDTIYSPVVESITMLSKPEQRIEGRSNLARFCVTYYIGEHLAKLS